MLKGSKTKSFYVVNTKGFFLKKSANRKEQERPIVWLYEIVGYLFRFLLVGLR